MQARITEEQDCEPGVVTGTKSLGRKLQGGKCAQMRCVFTHVIL